MKRLVRNLVFGIFAAAACVELVERGFSAPTDNATPDSAPDDTYGISPADPTSVQRGIDAAGRAHEKKVVIPPGVYRLPRVVGSSFHLHFQYLKNLEVDARGVTFVLTGRDQRAICFDSCEGVKFCGATFLREVPPFSQGKIVALAADRKSVDIRIDKGYPEDLDDARYFPHNVLNLYLAGTRKLKPLVPDLYVASMVRLAPDLFRFNFRANADPAIPIQIGDPAAWRGLAGCEVDSRACGRMLFQDITIESGMGIGFMEICGEGDNHYVHCVITYAPVPQGAVEQPLLACSADGFHSSSMRHGPTLEDCHSEGLDDDSVNIHGCYALLMTANDAKIVVDWRSPHRAGHYPFQVGRPGDTLRLYGRNGTLSSEARIVSVQPVTNYVAGDIGHISSRVFANRSRASYWEIILDKPVTAQPGGMVANANQEGDGFVIHNCTFRNSRGHGLLIKASGGAIKGCTIEGIVMAGIVLTPDMEGWNESDYAHDVTIEGNVIRDVGLGTEPWNSGVTVAGLGHGGYVPLPGGHRNIQILGNTFEDNRGPNIVVTSAIGVKIEHNQFVRPMTEPAFHIAHTGIDNTSALIWMRNADQVSLQGNVVDSAGSCMKSLIDTNATVKAVGLDTGISIQSSGAKLTQ